MRFKKDRYGNIQCECGCEASYPIECMDIFNDRLMSTHCIDLIQEYMFTEAQNEI